MYSDNLKLLGVVLFKIEHYKEYVINLMPAEVTKVGNCCLNKILKISWV